MHGLWLAQVARLFGSLPMPLVHIVTGNRVEILAHNKPAPIFAGFGQSWNSLWATCFSVYWKLKPGWHRWNWCACSPAHPVTKVTYRNASLLPDYGKKPFWFFGEPAKDWKIGTEWPMKNIFVTLILDKKAESRRTFLYMQSSVHFSTIAKCVFERKTT